MTISDVPSGRLDLTLHIGMAHSSTENVQTLLDRNRTRLSALGTLVPETPGAPRHHHLSWSAQTDHALQSNRSWRAEKFGTPQDFRTSFRRRLFQEINQSGLQRVVMSDEGLYGLPVRAVGRLRRFVDSFASGLRVIAYLPNQAEHVVTRYQVLVTGGETRSLSARTQETDFTGTYYYGRRMRLWKRVMEPTTLTAFAVDSAMTRSIGLQQQLLDAVGVGIRTTELEQPAIRSTELDAESIEMLRLLNIARLESPGLAAALPSNRALVPQLLKHATGPRLALPDQTLTEFMSLWEEANRVVTEEFLSDPTTSILEKPSSTSETVADQRLDPDRLDHFITLLELPEVSHKKLHKIARREASPR